MYFSLYHLFLCYYVFLTLLVVSHLFLCYYVFLTTGSKSSVPLLLCLLLEIYIELDPPLFLAVLSGMRVNDSKTDQADRMVGIVVHTTHELLSQRQDVVFGAQDLCLRDAT